MKIRDILRHKGPDVVTVSGAQTVMDAVRVLVERNIGGVVVVAKPAPIASWRR